MRTYPRPLVQRGRKFELSLMALYVFLLSVAPAVGQVQVWVDPGHCCTEPGALGYNGQTPHEKDLTFAVANYLQGDLLGLGWETYKTVNYPTSFLTPYNRAEVANGLRSNDDAEQGVPLLFVSIHMNSVPDPSAKGTITFYSERKSRQIDTKGYRADSTAAEYVHPDLMANANVAFLGCSEDDGIKVNEYAVCRYAFPPSLLIEVCFISNSCQWNNIRTAGDQALIADGIAAGVSGYPRSARDEPANTTSAGSTDTSRARSHHRLDVSNTCGAGHANVSPGRVRRRDVSSLGLDNADGWPRTAARVAPNGRPA